MTLLSFISMYVLMYLMVDRFVNVYPNFNQFYMAGIMTIPMILIELVFMGSMYHNKKLNTTIAIFSIGIFAVLLFFLRRQVAIDDKEFLKSMIPHHAGALLMCKYAKLQDSEIQALCKNISTSQQSEIDFMKAKLEILKK